jgi:predicted component of type VI protein secretion system
MQEPVATQISTTAGMCRHKWSASFHGNAPMPSNCLYCTVTDLNTADWLDAQALQPSENSAYLEDIKNGGKIRLAGFIFRIGRLNTNQIVVQDDSVSRTHAVITYENNKFFLLDLGSTNGTLINGSPVRGREYMNDQDIIRVGQVQFRFCCKTVIRHVQNSTYASAGC